MSYSVCKTGGKMCDGCMACYEEPEYDYDSDENEDEDEENGFAKARYKKSFLAKLTLADDEDYDLYNALKNHILTYKVKSRISWNYETFKNN